MQAKSRCWIALALAGTITLGAVICPAFSSYRLKRHAHGIQAVNSIYAPFPPLIISTNKLAL